MSDKRISSYTWVTDARYRTIGEAAMCDYLVAVFWPCEAAEGAAAQCLQQAAFTLDRLVSDGLPFRPTSTERLFDPVEVLNYIKYADLAGRDGFWADRAVGTLRHLGSALEGGAHPNQEIPGQSRFTLTLRRTFNVAGLDKTQSLRLRLPLPIEDDQTRDVQWEITDDGDLECRIAADRCRLEARGRVPKETLLSIAVRIAFTTVPGKVRSDEGDLHRYLKPSEGFIQVTPRVQALADRLAGGVQTPREAIACFWNFILDRLISGGVHYAQVLAAPAATDHVLETGWFDCQLGGSLLVALCRARAIPARLVSGYLLYSAAPCYHYWTEIWLADEGWAPFDVLGWDLSNAGRDAAWRNRFAGRLEPRMKTQCMPLRFTGSAGVAFPLAWHALERWTGIGTEVSYHALDTGNLVYSDRVDVVRS